MADRPDPSEDERAGAAPRPGPGPDAPRAHDVGLCPDARRCRLSPVRTSDAATVAARAPALAGIEAAANVNGRLADRLDVLTARNAALAASYGTIASAIDGLESRLGALSASVTAVDGAARALPAAVPLPPAIRTVRPTSRSTTHATTGGSGVP